jgi:N6-adenosine-specific RNA methylase IME4
VKPANTNLNTVIDDAGSADHPSIVTDLNELVRAGYTFPTVLADPPWRYSNTSSRGAAENHYPTMTLKQICDEPARQLVRAKAHLHLWTTNAFLEPAFEVVRAWGFEYKSCLIWAKPKIGMGNYWRVSHEFLLLGVRGDSDFGAAIFRVGWSLRVQSTAASPFGSAN